jgi:hypothetical protein
MELIYLHGVVFWENNLFFTFIGQAYVTELEVNHLTMAHNTLKSLNKLNIQYMCSYYVNHISYYKF